MKLVELKSQVYKMACRMVQDGLAHMSQGNISALDRESGLVAITPSAIPYDEMRVEDIVVIDRQGKVVEGKWRPSSEMRLHTIFYRERPDVGAVVHSHAPYATLFGVVDMPLPMILTEAATCLGQPVLVAPYRRPGTDELARCAIDTMAGGTAVIMAQHGLVAVGPDLRNAYDSTLAVETTARLIWMAGAMGSGVKTLEAEEAALMRSLYLETYHPTLV